MAALATICSERITGGTAATLVNLMTDDMIEGAFQFDLEEYSSGAYRREGVRDGRIRALLFATMMTVGDLALVARAWYVVSTSGVSSLPGGAHQLLIIIWIAVFFAALGVLGYWAFFIHLAPGADRVSLNKTDLIFHFPSGRVYRTEWGDRGFSIKLRDFSEWAKSHSLQGKFYRQFEAVMSGYPPTALPQEVFTVILTRARELGLRIAQSEVKDYRRGKGVLLTISH
jgi:hypothetical protein